MKPVCLRWIVDQEIDNIELMRIEFPEDSGNTIEVYDYAGDCSWVDTAHGEIKTNKKTKIYVNNDAFFVKKKKDNTMDYRKTMDEIDEAKKRSASGDLSVIAYKLVKKCVALEQHIKLQKKLDR